MDAFSEHVELPFWRAVQQQHSPELCRMLLRLESVSGQQGQQRANGSGQVSCDVQLSKVTTGSSRVGFNRGALTIAPPGTADVPVIDVPVADVPIGSFGGAVRSARRRTPASGRARAGRCPGRTPVTSAVSRRARRGPACFAARDGTSDIGRIFVLALGRVLCAGHCGRCAERRRTRSKRGAGASGARCGRGRRPTASWSSWRYRRDRSGQNPDTGPHR